MRLDVDGVRYVGELSEVATYIMRQESLEQQCTGLLNLQQKILSEYGEVMGGCIDEAMATPMGSKLRFATSTNMEMSTPLVRGCIDLLTNHLHKVQEYENSDEAQKYMSTYNVMLVEKEGRLYNGGYFTKTSPSDSDPKSKYYDDGTLKTWWSIKDSDEYKILRALKGVAPDVGKDELATLYMVLLFYISLKNEQSFVEQKAHLLSTPLPSSPEIAPRLPHNERKEHEGTIIPPNKKRAPRAKEVFTERAKICFQKAIGQGYMEQVGEGKYRWLFDGGSKVSLVYFHMRVYDFKARWKAWERLFDVTDLKQSAKGLSDKAWWRYRHARFSVGEAKYYKNHPPSSPEWFTELYDFFDD